MLFAVESNNGPTLYRSADGGATWQLLTAPLRFVVADPKNPGVMYGLGWSQVYRSGDDGATWISLPAAPPASYHSLAVDSAGNVYCADLTYGAGVAVSADGGTTWTHRDVPGMVEALVGDPDSAALYAATNTQVLVSTDGLATTRAIGVPPTITQLGVAPALTTGAPGVLFAIAAAVTSDAYVIKLDASGNTLWATYLGGSQDDVASAIAVDASGNVYVAGTTSSADFPSTPGAMGPKAGGGNFVAKLSPAGSLVYSAAFTEGGSIAALAVDAAGNAYVAGTITEYTGGGFFSFPVWSAIASKLDVAGARGLYSTKLTANRGNAIAVDTDGSAYVGGDASVWKLSPGGSLVYQSKLNGTAWALALDLAHTLYVAGDTSQPGFVTTPGAYQTRFWPYRTDIAGELVGYSGNRGFVMRLSPDTGEVLASTLLSGENWDRALALALDAAGNVTVGGVTASNSFPLEGAFQARFGYYAGFVARLMGDLSTLLFSTYVGDTRNFQVPGVAVGGDGKVFFAGDTSNATTPIAGTTTPSAAADSFVVDLNMVDSAPPVIQAVVNQASQVGTRIAPNQTIVVTAAGAGSGAVVLLDDQPLPTLTADAGRIVARIPVDYPVTSARTLRVQSGSVVPDPLLVAGAAAAPAIYTKDGSGRGEALVFHEDGSLNSPDNPAAPDSIIAIACNGVGRVTFDGDYAVAAAPVSVYVDGFYANGVDAHMVQLPGIPGDTYLIRVRVPNPPIEGFKLPPLVSLTLNVGGTSNLDGSRSQAQVARSIQQ